MGEQRPRVRIRFQYNMETGEIEEFLIDDNALAASEEYHDKVAQAIAGRLGREPQIEDAGLIRGTEGEPDRITEASERRGQEGRRKEVQEAEG